MFVASTLNLCHDATAHVSNETCGTVGDASDDAFNGACSTLTGDYHAVVPMDASCHANDSNGPGRSLLRH